MPPGLQAPSWVSQQCNVVLLAPSGCSHPRCSNLPSSVSLTSPWPQARTRNLSLLQFCPRLQLAWTSPACECLLPLTTGCTATVTYPRWSLSLKTPATWLWLFHRSPESLVQGGPPPPPHSILTRLFTLPSGLGSPSSPIQGNLLCGWRCPCSASYSTRRTSSYGLGKERMPQCQRHHRTSRNVGSGQALAWAVLTGLGALGPWQAGLS